MAIRIKNFSDGSFLEYDRGSFDNWCVYMTNTEGIRKPPKDTEYFMQLVEYSKKYGNDRIYQDFVKVYDMTNNELDDNVLNKITDISSKFKEEDTLEINKIFTILYTAMIAEERKKNTRLGKRIKRLGIHKLLKENETVVNAANFMRGMGWRDIDALCKERGF